MRQPLSAEQVIDRFRQAIRSKRKTSKFGVRHDAVGKANRTYNGILFDSMAEADYAAKLDLWKRTGVIENYERQVKVDLVVKDRKVCGMKIDFRVRWPDGNTRLVDVKGVVTREWALKAKLFAAIFGYEIDTVKNGIESWGQRPKRERTTK